MILVAGGTGLVGSKVVQTLLAQQIPVRVLARGGSDWASSSTPQLRRLGVEVVVGDITNAEIVRQAVEGCTAIVHSVGVMRAGATGTARAITVEGMRNMVDMGEQAGVQRFVYLSCLGAAQHSACDYYVCKWEAEQVLRSSNFYWTIFRPSLIYGANSQIQRVLEFLTSRTPFVPVIGSGLNRVSPVSAVDVASCVSASIYNREAVGKTYELVGAANFDLMTLLKDVAAANGPPKTTLSIPTGLAILIADWIARLNPKAPIDGDVMRIITQELTGDATEAEQTFQLRFDGFEPAAALKLTAD